MSIRSTATSDGPSAVQANGAVHTSADELLAAWAERDLQYVNRAVPLTDAEVQAIRAAREIEAGFVEPRRRGPIFVRARHWRPRAVGEWS